MCEREERRISIVLAFPRPVRDERADDGKARGREEGRAAGLRKGGSSTSCCRREW